MLEITQCTQVTLGAFGSGASGSSTISAKLPVPCGASDQLSGGEMSTPSQGYCAGILRLLANAGEVRMKAMGSTSTRWRLLAAPCTGKPSTSTQRPKAAAAYLRPLLIGRFIEESPTLFGR